MSLNTPGLYVCAVPFEIAMQMSKYNVFRCLTFPVIACGNPLTHCLYIATL